MTVLKLNREFLTRHIGVCLLMAGLACWFGYDGFVTYPKTPAAALYESIEKSPAPEGCDVEAFKSQKIKTQYGLAGLCLLASLAVGLHLLAVSRFRFAFDETGFEWKGERHPYSDVKSVDRSQWGKGKKGILVLRLERETISLDAWHHVPVSDFEKML